MISQRSIWSRCSIIICGLTLTACISSVPPTLVLVTVAPSSTSAVTVLPTLAPSPTDTAIPSPVSPTHTPTAAATPVPTLTAEQQAEFVSEMLKTNDSCELPCWWGIEPGETQFQMVKGIFSSRGIPLFSDNRGGGFSVQIPHPDRHFDYVVDVEFYSEQGMTRSILVRSEIFRGQTSQRFARDWRRYAWDQVLIRYGSPSWVSLGFDAPLSEPGAPVTYKLTILYESLGVAIDYEGPAQYDPKAIVVRACPRFNEVTNVRLALVSARQGNSVIDLILKLSGAPGLGPSLEDTTGMSIQAFYETFKVPSGGTCLERQLTSP